MKDFIKALKILLKYGDAQHPFICKDTILYFTAVSPEDVAKKDIIKLQKLGVHVMKFNNEPSFFYSYRFGR